MPCRRRQRNLPYRAGLVKTPLLSARQQVGQFLPKKTPRPGWPGFPSFAAALLRRTRGRWDDVIPPAQTCRGRAEALRTVNAILDNLTETNREFADVRIAELEVELKRIEPRMAELEAQLVLREAAPL